MRNLFFIVVIIISIILAGCSKSTNINSSTDTSNAVDSKATANQYQRTKNEFSAISDKGFVSLKDWDKDFDLAAILGKPIEEKLEKLGTNADAHAGSSIKTLIYEGMTVKLFSPRDNGEVFWIMKMDVYSNNFQTLRNISVGNTLLDLKTAYNNILQVLDGRTDPNNCAYSYNESELFIKFEIKDGVVKEMSFYVEIP